MIKRFIVLMIALLAIACLVGLAMGFLFAEEEECNLICYPLVRIGPRTWTACVKACGSGRRSE